MCSTRRRLGVLLREQREALGLSQRQAARIASIASSTLSRWESGTCDPRVPELQSLLSALGVDGQGSLRILASQDTPRAARAVRHERAAPSGGELLRVLRVRAGLSLVEVASQFGVATSTVSRWESSLSRPSRTTLSSLLLFLGASPEERLCVESSGLAKVRSASNELSFSDFETELSRLEQSFGVGDFSVGEIRILQLKSLLWWQATDPEYARLLTRVQVIHDRFTERRGRARLGSAIAESSMARC